MSKEIEIEIEKLELIKNINNLINESSRDVLNIKIDLKHLDLELQNYIKTFNKSFDFDNFSDNLSVKQYITPLHKELLEIRLKHLESFIASLITYKEQILNK